MIRFDNNYLNYIRDGVALTDALDELIKTIHGYSISFHESNLVSEFIIIIILYNIPTARCFDRIFYSTLYSNMALFTFDGNITNYCNTKYIIIYTNITLHII